MTPKHARTGRSLGDESILEMGETLLKRELKRKKPQEHDHLLDLLNKVSRGIEFFEILPEHTNYPRQCLFACLKVTTYLFLFVEHPRTQTIM